MQADLVTDPQVLARLCDRWSQSDILGLDTEFVRTRTFYPHLGLIQIADRQGVHLVDPVALDDLGPLTEILRLPEVLKVFHSCSEDLEVLYYLSGFMPRPVFDTQVAASFLGHGPAIGYQRLVEALCGVDLPKGETRTDWLRRPLSDAQLRYAALDVAYLMPLYDQLAPELESAGRRTWAEEELAPLFDIDRFLPDPDHAYLRIRQARSMSRRELAVLQALAAWREREARRRDLPRNFVVQENALVALARTRPRNSRQLRGLEILRPQENRRYGTRLLELIREAQTSKPQGWPPTFEQRPRLSKHKDDIKSLRATVARRAAEIGLPAELLATKRVVEQLAARVLGQRKHPLPPQLRGWRQAVIGDDLLQDARRLLGS